MEFYWLALGVLAVWRITHLLSMEDGPFEIVVRLRARMPVGFWSGLVDCFYCLSLWAALPLALLVGVGWGERLLLWPALSGGAMLLQRATGPAIGPAVVEPLSAPGAFPGEVEPPSRGEQAAGQ